MFRFSDSGGGIPRTLVLDVARTLSGGIGDDIKNRGDSLELSLVRSTYVGMEEELVRALSQAVQLNSNEIGRGEICVT